MKRYKAEINNKQYIIEQDLSEVGWYLYIYENGKCTHDYLQDKLETAKEQAKEDFDVPLDIWVEIEVNIIEPFQAMNIKHNSRPCMQNMNGMMELIKRFMF